MSKLVRGSKRAQLALHAAARSKSNVQTVDEDTKAHSRKEHSSNSNKKSLVSHRSSVCVSGDKSVHLSLTLLSLNASAISLSLTANAAPASRANALSKYVATRNGESC